MARQGNWLGQVLVVAMIGMAGGAMAQDGHTAPPAGPGWPGQMQLRVDASDVQRRLQRVQQIIPAQPGTLTLWYPQWIPGHHAPTGPINQIAGLRLQAKGKPLVWQRDPLNMYAINVQVPEGVDSVQLSFDYLSPTATDQGRVAMTQNLLSIQWHRVLFYPANTDTRQVQVAATLCLPQGWQAGSSLRGRRQADCLAYRPVDLMTLIDSPVYAGRHYRAWPLDAGQAQPVVLHAVAEQAGLLQPTTAVLDAHKALVAEADALFGHRPYAHYDFLLAISDIFSGIGLEHAQSSENGMHEGYLQGQPPVADNDLLAHEYVHAWIGKAWRPAGSWVAHYNGPMDNRGLWVYEGLTQYWALVLAARSGLWNNEQVMARLAQLQAHFASQAGRQWRDLADTQYQGIADFNDKPQAWADWQRGFDFYDEGILLWLAIDAQLRAGSQGTAMLDRFTRDFHQAAAPAQIQLFAPEQAAAALAALAPGNWQGFIDQRLHQRDGRAPDGLAIAGWELVYSDQPNALVADAEVDGSLDLQFSLGIKVGSDGVLRWVGWESPAFKAGLARDMQLLAVNGLSYSGSRLRQAVRDAQAGAPVELLLRQDDTLRTVRMDYRDGLRYPQLQRIEGQADLLTPILQPRRGVTAAGSGPADRAKALR